MATAVSSEQLGEDLGGDKRPQACGDFEQARDVGSGSLERLRTWRRGGSGERIRPKRDSH